VDIEDREQLQRYRFIGEVHGCVTINSTIYKPFLYLSRPLGNGG
jgi:hypothetical protein